MSWLPSESRGEPGTNLRVAMDAAPFIDENGRLLVPVRFLAQAMGVADSAIAWDSGAQTVRITALPRVSADIEFTVGSPEYRVVPFHTGAPSQVCAMDTAPRLLPPGRVFLPLRYLAEALGWGVWWDEKAQTATLVRWDPDLPGPLAEKLSRPFYWVAYNPTNYDPESGVWPDESSIRADLETLRRAGFRGLVTYGLAETLAELPRLAKGAGFETVIAGVWDPRSPQETAAARVAAPYADAFCVGNEGLLTGRYRLAELFEAMEKLRLATGRPVTTSEPVHLYFKQSALQRLGDFLLPVVHPYWAGIKEPQAAAEFTLETWQKLNQASQRKVLIKETGLPNAGEPGLSEEAQFAFYRHLSATGAWFTWFEAFDQTWKVSRPWVQRSPIETHWGLYDAARRPKAAAHWLEERAASSPRGEAGRPLPGPPLVFTHVPP
ncbi:MAG: stalk domain-containing protein [Desulfotomaculales bacterium]